MHSLDFHVVFHSCSDSHGSNYGYTRYSGTSQSSHCLFGLSGTLGSVGLTVPLVLLVPLVLMDLVVLMVKVPLILWFSCMVTLVPASSLYLWFSFDPFGSYSCHDS